MHPCKSFPLTNKQVQMRPGGVEDVRKSGSLTNLNVSAGNNFGRHCAVFSFF